MGLKYVINSMKRRKLRTFIIALALTVGVALVGALLALVDTQRQFSIQSIGQQTGGYDLSISKSNLAQTPFFDIDKTKRVASNAYSKISAIHPRIQMGVEGRRTSVLDGQAVTVIAIEPDFDNLVTIASESNTKTTLGINLRIGGVGNRAGPGGPPGGPGNPPPGGNTSQFGTSTNSRISRITPTAGGVFPPNVGQVFLDSSTAGLLGTRIGDEIQLAYTLPIARELGGAVITSTSSPRVSANFVVAGIGTLSGLSSDVSNPVVIQLSDAQRWLNIGLQANQLLLVWQSNTSGTNDPRVTVSGARDVGEQVRNELQKQLGNEFNVSLPKYANLENSSQIYLFAQTFISLYGLLSIGIVGLMVNALMITTVAEQKYDLAILRVLGSPRKFMYEAVVIEVIVLGLVGIVIGLLLGRALNDYVIVPTLASSLNIPSGVSPDWTLQTVLIPTAITALVLAIATINPARAAAATKVMVVLNPAAADQPTLDDLSKLRERRAQGGLMLAGVVLLAFSAIVLIVLPLVFTPGNTTGTVVVTFGSLLLMVIGMSLIFYFFTTPIERVLVWLYEKVSRGAGFFAGRYAMRGKGRNAIISLMVVMSGVLPTLLATQLALQDANLETDRRFNAGAPLTAQIANFGGLGGQPNVFRATARRDPNISAQDIAAITSQNGIGDVVGVADNLRGMQASDEIQLRSSSVSFIGVQGDLNKVLYPTLFRWSEGNATALTRIATEQNVVIISQGLSEALDLHVNDIIRLRGTGNDNEKRLTIIAVGARIPGFSNYFTKYKTDAGRSGILMNIETYRSLKNNPFAGTPDPNESLLTKLMVTVRSDVNEANLLRSLRDYLGNRNDMTVIATSEQVATARTTLDQTRVFTILLTGLSMITAIFGVLAVMYTAVMSRRVEIGMLKAVGAAKGTLRGVFVGEAIITTLAAGVAGIFAGTVLGYAFEISQRLQTDQLLQLAFDFRTAGLIVALVCVAALFSAILATQPVIKQKAIRILRERA
jgi:ABC-type antimicrobial peptide transport system permease subunit